MKARFYRGPWDGKVKSLAPDTYNLRVSIPNTKPAWLGVGVDVYLDPDVLPIHKMYNVYIYRRTRHTHPDGSVFFEWDKPKGSKI